MEQNKIAAQHVSNPDDNAFDINSLGHGSLRCLFANLFDFLLHITAIVEHINFSQKMLKSKIHIIKLDHAK